MLHTRTVAAAVAAVVLTLSLLLLLVYQMTQHGATAGARDTASQVATEPAVDDDFARVVRARAGTAGHVYVAVVDSAHMAMAQNLFLTSIRPLHIHNYLFIGGDGEVCDRLSSLGIMCYTKFHHTDANNPSFYATKQFRQKTAFKTALVLEILKLGIAAVLMDNDIVLFKVPMPYFTCTDCDITLQDDMQRANSGFYYARPTAPAIEFFTRVHRGHGQLSSLMDDQDLFHYNIVYMTSVGELKVDILDRELFVPGIQYFEIWKIQTFEEKQQLDRNVVMVHNNWIVGIWAKVLRFKELHLWKVDSDKYYSDTKRKYITYENPFDFGTETITQEIIALKTAFAMAMMLDRTVLLPYFSCSSCKRKSCENSSRCHLLYHFLLRPMDEHLKDFYRESSFLQNPMVPDSIRNSKESSNLIVVDLIQDKYTLHGSKTHMHHPSNATAGASIEELTEWFGADSSPVLKFHSLYGAMDLTRFKLDGHFGKEWERIEKGIVSSNDYMQWEREY